MNEGLGVIPNLFVFTYPQTEKLKFAYPLKQGSQTQSDSRAALDSKKGLAGRI